MQMVNIKEQQKSLFKKERRLRNRGENIPCLLLARNFKSDAERRDKK
jgi:hypothetical protein